jgi:hypothetical protein
MSVNMKKPLPNPAITAYDDAPSDVALSDVVERNIRTVLRLRAQSAQSRSTQERLADAITAF